MSPVSTIAIVVLIVLVVYFYYQNSKSKLAADAAVANNTVNTCVPFTKAQQDAEKRKKQADCLNKNLIPFVGTVQSAACLANVDSTLTPIKNC